MPQYTRPLIGVVVAFTLLLGSGALQGQPGESSYAFKYTVALIQGLGQNRGIVEMAGTVSVNSSSSVALRLKKPHAAKVLAGENLFRPTEDLDLLFRKDEAGHWVLEKGRVNAAGFTDLLGLIMSLQSVQATGQAPRTQFAVKSNNLVEQERTGWEESDGLLVLRDSPNNGLLLKSSATVLQGIKIGSTGQFDQMKDRLAGGTVDFAALEELVANARTDHLSFIVVTLSRI